MRKRRALDDRTKQNSDICARPDDMSHLICWLPGGSRNRKTITLKVDIAIDFKVRVTRTSGKGRGLTQTVWDGAEKTEISEISNLIANFVATTTKVIQSNIVSSTSTNVGKTWKPIVVKNIIEKRSRNGDNFWSISSAWIKNLSYVHSKNIRFLTIVSEFIRWLVEFTEAITNPPKKQPSSIDIPSDWVVNSIMNITANCPNSSISFEKLWRNRNKGETRNLTKMKQTPEIRCNWFSRKSLPITASVY